MFYFSHSFTFILCRCIQLTCQWKRILQAHASNLPAAISKWLWYAKKNGLSFVSKRLSSLPLSRVLLNEKRKREKMILMLCQSVVVCIDVAILFTSAISSVISNRERVEKSERATRREEHSESDNKIERDGERMIEIREVWKREKAERKRSSETIVLYFSSSFHALCILVIVSQTRV